MSEIVKVLTQRIKDLEDDCTGFVEVERNLHSIIHSQKCEIESLQESILDLEACS